MKKTKPTNQNLFPIQNRCLNLNDTIRFWRNQSLTHCDDKGGSFNVELYLRILAVKHQQS
jgi:hypothetical protein